MLLLTKDIKQIERKKHNNISGIYMIYNKINNKIYIGSAANLQKRKDHHLSLLRNKKHDSKHLQRAWNKYGEENFIFYVLDIIDTPSLSIREQYYLDTLLFANSDSLKFKNLGYNKAKNAERSGLGRIVSDKIRKRMSEDRKGNKNPMFGKKMSDITRKKVSDNNAKYWLGKTHSEETIKKICLKNVDVRGSKNGWAKLTETKVIALRKFYAENKITFKELGLKYKISAANACDIINRKSWKHI